MPNKTRSTPTQTGEPVSPPNPVRRRSLRLSSSSFTPSPSPKRTRIDPVFTPRTRKDAVSSGKNPNFDSSINDGSELDELDGSINDGSLRSGTRVLKQLSIGGDNDGVCDDTVDLNGVIDDVNNNNHNDDDDSARVRVRVSDEVIAEHVSIGGANDVKLDGGKELGQNEVINRENDGVIDDVKELGQNGRNGFRSLRSGTVLIGDSNDGVISNDVELDGVISRVVNDIKELGRKNGVIKENKEVEVLSLRSGTRVVKRLSIGGVDEDAGNLGRNDNDGSVRVSDVVQELSRNDGGQESITENGFLSLRSGTRVEKRVSIGGHHSEFNDGIKIEEQVSSGGGDDNVVTKNVGIGLEVKEEEGGGIGGDSSVKGKRRLIVDAQVGVVKMEEDDGLSSFVVEQGLCNRGTNVMEDRVVDYSVSNDQCVAHRVGDDCSGVLPDENMLASPRRYTRDEKGKRQWIVDDEGDVVQVEEGGLSSFLVEQGLRYGREEEVKSDSVVDDRGVVNDAWSSFSVKEGLGNSKRYTREEKGKGVASSDDVVIGGNDDEDLVTLNLEPEVDFPGVGLNAGVEADHGINIGGDVIEVIDNMLQERKQKSMREIHKRIARRNASKYAHFSMDDDETMNEGTGVEQEDGNDTESEAEVPQEDRGLNVEDWPGPFSTAMKIISDREKKMGVQANAGVSIGDMPLISWTPNKKIGIEGTRSAPSLQTMCLKILAENVDAIHSLNYVPEVLRHKLCQMLCDSRRMNAHFFSLLLQGSPAEIRVADCSWLEEEEFESSIKACDTSKLTVLQLDLCGHCISDASLIKAVAPKGLPVLTTISLKGACRISDAGLAALVSAAPVLRSMNLSQCSLLTVVGIKTIADSLGSIVHELYLDDCDTLNAMSILPSLKRLVHLEVLSLRGIGGVSDKFIRKLITSNGHNMKELVLANCVNLTDSSLKVITEKCSQLCVLDLSYLRKLTDVGMAYLADGCRGIQDLRLCRNAFSDCAIAAFLEASGESLKELSLNNLTKVGQNTTLSLARRCKNLERLDLSWCRSLTDEALGLIADSCLSLRLLKIFGCTQITKMFLDGHSNANLHVVGMKLTPILEHIKRPDFQHGPLYYSAVPSS